MVSTTNKIQTRSEYDTLRIKASEALTEAGNAKGENHKLKDDVQKAIDALNQDDPITARKILMDILA